jgi:coatomer protein complex subunit gamma
MDTTMADEFEEVASIPLKSLPYGSPGQTFLLLSKPEGAVALGKFGNVLKFKVKEVSRPPKCDFAAIAYCLSTSTL